MTKIRDIVDASLRRANVLGSGQTAGTNEAIDALERLNDWMASWPSVGWVVTDSAAAAYTHTALTLTSDWPLSDEFVFGTKAILSAMICEEFGSPVTPVLASDRQEGLQAYRRAFAPATTATFPRVLKSYLRCR